MSFQNDDERDGLASLFGGITPQASEPGRRRAAPEQPPADSSPAPSPAAPPPAAQGVPVSDAPAYPGLEPSIPVSPPPAAIPPASGAPTYPSPPAFTPEPPAFGSPTGGPAAVPPPAYTPPTYAAPAEPPVVAPTGPFGEPPTAGPASVEGGRYAAPPSEPQQPYVAPQPYVPPAYVPPVTTAQPDPGSPAPYETPGYALPVPGFDHTTPTYDLPAPAAPPAAPYVPPAPLPGYPPPQADGAAVAPPAPGLQYPGLEPATPAYPPTAQYPTGIGASSPMDDPVSELRSVPEPQSTAYPHPLSEPQPVSDAPPLGGFAALGLEPVELEPAGQEPPGVEPPTPDRGGDSGPASSSMRSDAGAVEPSAQHAGSTPVLRRPPGPLLPTERPVVVAPEDLSRATTFEKIGLALAIIGGPLGLLLAIVNGARGVRRRGWLIRLGRASIVLGILSSIAAGIGGVTLWNIREAQLARDQVAAASAEFCDAAAANPQLVEPPLLGWPEPGATITESLTLMEAWTTQWTDLAAVSPAGLRTGLEQLATRGGEVIAAVQQSRLVNDAENERVVGATASSSGVANWYETYCVAP